MSSKRPRTEPPARIEFKVHFPNEPPPIEMIASSGKGLRPKYAIRPVQFTSTTPHKFSKLWLQFPDHMLCKEGESEPFMDFEAPLVTLETRAFVATEWKPEYERQRQHLLRLQYTENLERLDTSIVAHEAELVAMRKRRDVLAARLEDISKYLADTVPK